MTDSLLVVMALEVEAQGRFADGQVLFTGLGKVNAVYRLTRRLAEERAQGRRPLVLNFGTAGSRRHPHGSVIGCDRFVQRDMDVTELGFAHGETPFEEVPRELSFEPVFEALPRGVCATGDRFETLDHSNDWDVIDMEAYALAKVCRFEGLSFGCAKFITDGADENASSDWQANLPRAADAFLELYRQIRHEP
jgi:adenosylhomocysteine nucleosidase